MRSSNRVLGSGLVLLAMAVATVAALGPLVFGVLRYRISATSLNQIIGSDAAALTVVVPVTVAVAVLAIRGHPAAPVLALAPSVFVVYTYTQLIVGNEYLRLPGNVERFFPLLLAAFILAAAIALWAWNSVPAARLPATSTRVDRTAGVLLLVIATFVLVGAENGSGTAVRAQAAALLQSGALRIIDRQPRHEIPGYLGLADVLVSPRLHGGNLPLKVFDYLAAGRAIVATDIPTHRTVLNEELAVLVPPIANDLARGIVSLLRVPERAVLLARAGRRYAEQHLGWSGFVESLGDLYEDVHRHALVRRA